METAKRINRTIDKIITKVNCQYGAPLGRSNKGERPHTITSGKTCKVFKKYQKKIFDCVVPMCCNGDYDKGGVYWGLGEQLRVSYTKDLSYICFYRKGDETW